MTQQLLKTLGLLGTAAVLCTCGPDRPAPTEPAAKLSTLDGKGTTETRRDESVESAEQRIRRISDARRIKGVTPDQVRPDYSDVKLLRMVRVDATGGEAIKIASLDRLRTWEDHHEVILIRLVQKRRAPRTESPPVNINRWIVNTDAPRGAEAKGPGDKWFWKNRGYLDPVLWLPNRSDEDLLATELWRLRPCEGGGPATCPAGVEGFIADTHRDYEKGKWWRIKLAELGTPSSHLDPPIRRRDFGSQGAFVKAINDWLVRTEVDPLRAADREREFIVYPGATDAEHERKLAEMEARNPDKFEAMVEGLRRMAAKRRRIMKEAESAP